MGDWEEKPPKMLSPKKLAKIGAKGVDCRESNHASWEQLKMMKRLENKIGIHVGEMVRFGRPLSMAVVSVSSPRHYTLWNALAAESLAGDVRGFFGTRVKVSVFRVRSDTECRSVILSLKQLCPDVLGVSVECGGVDLTCSLVGDLMDKVWTNGQTSEAPDLLFGGKIPTYFPEFFLAKFPSSIAVLGEGELPMRRLVSRYFDPYPESLCEIPNLAYCDDSLQPIRSRSEQPSCSGLVFPPSTDTVSELLEAGAGTLMTQASRGCSWSKCTYCTVSSFRGHKKWEPLPWNRVRQHMESLIALGVREFEFCDDEFMGGRDAEHLDRVTEIANDLKRLAKQFENGIAFRIFLIPHTVFRSEDPAGNLAVSRVLQELKQAGLVRVYFGVESGSDAQLKRYCRGTPRDDVIGALNVVKRLRVGIDCGFIMFDPQATVEDIWDNVRFFRKHQLIRHNQWPFRPLIANSGAGFGQVMARRGIPPDADYMCYRYSFGDPKVQNIFDIVDELSAKTRSLFYTLKVISKVHFDPAAESRESRRARDYVIQNGLVYLDLIETLITSSDGQGWGRSLPGAICNAENAILSIIKEVQRDLAGGFFGPYSERLESELDASSITIPKFHQALTEITG